MESKDDKTNNSSIALFNLPSGRPSVQVRLQDGSVWLTQLMMADLYHTSKQNISFHIHNIYQEEELIPEATVKKYLIARTEGSRQVKRAIDHYSLDMILAVGYRVRSSIATSFRKWATATLKEYVVKGFVLDDERLKGNNAVVDYFDELLARIRDIRASEARFISEFERFFRLLLIIEKARKRLGCFLPLCRTKCIMPPQV